MNPDGLYGISYAKLIELLDHERDSEHITMFRLQSEQVDVLKKSIVSQNWKLFRKHIPIQFISVSDDLRSVVLRLPAWLGARSFSFNFYFPGECDVVVDCIDMHMRFETLKGLVSS